MIDDEAMLSTVVATAFMQRRKTLRNALRKLAGPTDFTAAGIDPALRLACRAGVRGPVEVTAPYW